MSDDAAEVATSKSNLQSFTDCFEVRKLIWLGLKELFLAVAFPPLGIVISYLLIIPIYENLGLVPKSGLVEAFWSLVGPGICFSLAEMCFSRYRGVRQSTPWRNGVRTPLKESMRLGAFLATGTIANCLGGLYTLTLTLKGGTAVSQTATEPTLLAWVVVVATSIICLVVTAFFLGASTKLLESFELSSEPWAPADTVNSNKEVER